MRALQNSAIAIVELIKIQSKFRDRFWVVCDRGPSTDHLTLDRQLMRTLFLNLAHTGY